MTGLYKDIKIPKYTYTEEAINTISHMVGAILGFNATILCIMQSIVHHNTYGIISGTVYGLTMIILYTASSIYHSLNPDRYLKKVFRVIDHCSIYLLIAGTFTPLTLCAIREANPTLGWIYFGTVWILSIVGIVLNTISLEKFKVVSMILYIGIGWCIALVFKILISSTGIVGTALLFGGGIAYTVGALFYGIGKKKSYMHCVFHIFILIGSMLHLLCILLYVL